MTEKENAMKKLLDNWIVMVVTLFLTLVANVVTSNIIMNKSKIDNSASVEYVNTKTSKIESDYKQADTEINKKIEKFATKEDIDVIRQDIRELRQLIIKK